MISSKDCGVHFEKDVTSRRYEVTNDSPMSCWTRPLYIFSAPLLNDQEIIKHSETQAVELKSLMNLCISIHVIKFQELTHIVHDALSESNIYFVG